MRYESNRTNAEEIISGLIKKKIVGYAVEYERLLDDEFTSPKHGRLYGPDVNFVAFDERRQAHRVVAFRTNSTVTHRASAPGEAPAIWTAALRKSIKHKIVRIGKMDWSALIGVSFQGGRGAPTGASGKSIAEDLEFGTSKMGARPGWRLALAKLISRART